MPQLRDLEGRPMTWAELHERNERYWSLRSEQERYDPPTRASGKCTILMHYQCSGRMVRVPGSTNRYDTIECRCYCHGAAA